MFQKNKIVGYRKMLGKTQTDMAEVFGVSRQAYYLKENGNISFKDSEKVLFKNMLSPLFPEINIDDIFF
ncbi:transcriptional regulator [Melissococcus plutonius]|uniref:helix-turn-helix transcriptional regulator n=1 Tax=Melissococcus plutonius TaxID=33970 RepID=UPI00065E1308|nr:transcriptional regulator [Melissococcus plutonius]AIM25791.1 hypothetical protein MEPL_c010580 [Melissococcus plutonius S1]KMT23489.1 hypothetical protein MEPL2_43p00710 [Melissococcus plutonius]KMT25247.1 hypothetical protein MEPL2_2c08050 [Melissococcus plutonius]KMT26153.1 hypothetical protein MEPL3_3c00780 [Melissococcus plutonius]KMT26883.1 hypothetical protein MEPL1_4c00780 [Melissococcus plutonius]